MLTASSWPAPRSGKQKTENRRMKNPRMVNRENTGSGIASARNAVKDLRPLRGALSRVLDRIPGSGWDSTYGSVPLPVSRKKPEPLLEKNMFLFDRSHPLRK